MSADAQSALSDEFSSTATPFSQSQTHHRSTLLQQRPAIPGRFSPERSTIDRSHLGKGQESTARTTAFEPFSARSTENLPIAHPSHTGTLPLNYPPISDTSDQQIAPQPVTTALQKLQDQVQHTIADQITPLRLAGHLSVLAVAAIILILSQVNVPDWNLPLASALPNSVLGGQRKAANTLNATFLSSELQDSSSNLESLQRIALPFTTAPEKPRDTIDVHIVQSGETILGIAAQFGLQPETIMWANPAIERNPDRISIGDELKILPVNGVLHTVRSGDTLSSLAAKYKVEMQTIVDYSYNNLADSAAGLTVGTDLIIPGGEKPLVAQQVVAAYSGPVPASASKGSGSFAWPTSGNVTQGYWGGHAALDIGSWTGAPVKVADSGYVVYVGRGWSSGYGNHVVVDHGNGYTTLYAHLNSIFVLPGENLGKGSQIGTVGNTVNSTGPHLHFEISY
ncbi:MAG: M23 family metallopeptidase, partial [Caldilineaceae bacterium]|nr:M23 family metallopeptidase [Caldilineaceae bacterium]